MRISRRAVTLATFSAIAVVAARVAAFEQSVPEAPASAFDQVTPQAPASVFHSFVPPPAATLEPVVQTPEADLKAYREGNEAFQHGDYEKARKNWELLAERGDVFAQWQLGNMYRKGQGVPVDHARAFHYYRLAAAQHEDVGRYTARTRVTVDAIVQLAHYYEVGLQEAGILRNAAYAQKLYHGTATHFRHPGAQYHLGKMYLTGKGATKNVSRGLRWLNLAAQKRYAPAQAALGDVYWSGQGVEVDRPRGLMWYMLAAKNADPSREQEIIERFRKLQASAEEKDRLRAQALLGNWSKRYSERNK